MEYLADSAEGLPIWITETGLATWDLQNQEEGRFELQQQMRLLAAQAPVDRIYWYSLIDLDARRDAIEGFHEDENEYHLGLVRFDHTRKPAFATFRDLSRAGARLAS